MASPASPLNQRTVMSAAYTELDADGEGDEEQFRVMTDGQGDHVTMSNSKYRQKGT